MSKKCIHCGHPLSEDASFCPYCASVQTEKQKVKEPKRWRKKLFFSLMAGILLLLAGTAVFLHHQPQSFEGNASLKYTDGSKNYLLVLNFFTPDGLQKQGADQLAETISDGMNSSLPCQLFVFDEADGSLAWEEFTEKVDNCQIELTPLENARKMEFTEPRHDESFPDAAYMADINYQSDCGTNEIGWTLSMKNGDTLHMKTSLTITRQEAVTYEPETTAMDTSKDLLALLSSIEKDVPSDTVVSIYLPPVTYEGDFSFTGHTFQIYGGDDGSRSTTFTGTLTLKDRYSDLYSLRFEGNGGTGVDAYTMVFLTDCTFEGWEKAAVAHNGGWVTLQDCSFSNNTIGLEFDSYSSSGTAATYENNTFTGNETAILLKQVPGTEILSFPGCTFTGNETDIENRADHPIDTSLANFE